LFEDIVGYLFATGLIYWVMIIGALVLLIVLSIFMLRKKYGFVRLPWVHFDWRVINVEAIGADGKQTSIFDMKNAYLRFMNIEKARLHEFSESGATIYKLVLQGNPFNFFKKATNVLPPDYRFDWGNHTTILVYGKETDTPVFLEPTLHSGKFNMPDNLTEAERSTTLANYRAIVAKSIIHEPSLFERLAPFIMGMILIIAFALAAWQNDNISKSQVEVAKANLAATEILAQSAANMSIAAQYTSRQTPTTPPPAWT